MPSASSKPEPEPWCSQQQPLVCGTMARNRPAGAKLAGEGGDFVLIEGYGRSRTSIRKIVFGKNEREILELVDENTVAFSGIGSETTRITGIPHLPIDIEDEELVDFIQGAAR